jgi:Zn finger protein HypA/HybF involved in hydrogenase expression
MKRDARGSSMGRKLDPKFFECLQCENATLLSTTASESTCPGCGSANGRVISISELERRIDEGAVFAIDLSPGKLREERKRQ